MENTTVSADDENFALSAGFPFTNHSLMGTGVQWSFEQGADGHFEITDASLNQDNESENYLTHSKTRGTRYTVRVESAPDKVIIDGKESDYQFFGTSSDIIVTSGAPVNMVLNSVKTEYFALESDYVTLEATLTDKFGQQVEDGTLVRWGVSGGGSLETTNYQTVTTNGMTSAKIYGDFIPGVHLICLLASLTWQIN